jgi:2-polyprenyl-3-methyl-5-hydroxy-6-metoxy-1,4-benzoquinol methylase
MRDFNQELRDNEFRKYNYGFDIITRRYLLKEFSAHFSEGYKSSVLEVGSFDGSMTELILEYFSEIEVVEAAREMADLVKTKFGKRVKIHQGLIENVKIERKFDCIFLIHTLEHVDDPVSVLKLLAEKLKSSGKLFIAVPNANALSRQIAVQMGIIESNQAVPSGEAAQGHQRTYALDTLRRDVLASGLIINKLGGVILKAFANFQLDAAMSSGIIDLKYIDAANELAKIYPDFSTSIFAVVSKSSTVVPDSLL